MADPGGRWLLALIAYGAVILAFLGGVHWGLALIDPDNTAIDPPTSGQNRMRLVLGVVPALIGWFALLSTSFLPPNLSLGVIIAGFVATMLVEARAARVGLVPGGYLWLRWALSVVVILALGSVFVVRLVGGHIGMIG